MKFGITVCGAVWPRPRTTPKKSIVGAPNQPSRPITAPAEPKPARKRPHPSASENCEYSPSVAE